jgi:predicted hotdog family 3-hydroxylacyl-ACP dehydratase
MKVIGRDEILRMIPHAGSMCLLDEVLGWDAVSVRCLSRRYRAQDNPMRRADGRLGSACGIEIAAQAMAVHGRLSAAQDRPPTSGYLVSLRDVNMSGLWLDRAAGDLLVNAERLLGDARTASYHFSLAVEGVMILTGRATVVLDISA